MLVLGRISIVNTEVVLWSVVGGVGADGGQCCVQNLSEVQAMGNAGI